MQAISVISAEAVDFPTVGGMSFELAIKPDWRLRSLSENYCESDEIFKSVRISLMYANNLRASRH